MIKSWPCFLSVLLAAAGMLPMHAYSGVVRHGEVDLLDAIGGTAVVATASAKFNFNLTDVSDGEVSYVARYASRTSEVTFSVSF